MAAAAIWLMTATLLLLAPFAAGASEPAGRVIFSTGEVTAVDTDGVRRELARDTEVRAGDTVHTAQRARVDLRMRDDALLSLESDSRLTLERYEQNDDGAAQAVMRFLRGTLRTVTGTIGKQKDDTYRMTTPVATIGVRGTQYALQLCDADCAGPEREAGLYGYVEEGAIEVANDADGLVVSRNEYFHVADSDVAPRKRVRLPDGILGYGESTGGDTLVAGDEMLLDDAGLLETTTSTLLTTTTDTLTGTTETLLGTSGSLLQTGGGLLQDSGDLLAGTGDVLEGTGDTLGVGEGLLDTTGGLLDTGDDLLDTTGGLLGDTGDSLGGDGSLLEEDGEDDLFDEVEDLLDLDGDGNLL